MGSKLSLTDAQDLPILPKLSDQTEVRVLIDRLRSHPVRLKERMEIYDRGTAYMKIM